MKYALRHINHNFSYNRLKLLYCSAALLAFLGGMAIYAFFRNLNIVLFQFFPKPSFLEALHFPVRTDTILMTMFLFNLPDGLWFLSGLLIIRAVWFANTKWRAIYFCLFSLIVLSMEVSQISKGIPGTFDLLDLSFMAFFALAESLIFKLFVKRNVIR